MSDSLRRIRGSHTDVFEPGNEDAWHPLKVRRVSKSIDLPVWDSLTMEGHFERVIIDHEDD